MSTATARTRNKPEVNSGVTITPLTGSIGATISGLRLAEVTSDQFAAIREAFLANCMLVFRDQFLSVDEHVAFAARWGEFEVNAMSPYLDNYPMVLGLSNRGKAKAVTENWRSKRVPDKAVIERLRSVCPAQRKTNERDIDVAKKILRENGLYQTAKSLSFPAVAKKN